MSGECFASSPAKCMIIFGPMFSGKTTELMRRLKRYQISTHKCLVIKYSNDIRYDSNGIATHDNQVLPALSVTSLGELKDNAEKYSVIGIDEGQFFPDIVEFAEEMANNGKIVIVAALDGTYQRLGFGSILQLVPLAESVVKLTAVCMICYEEASYTKRTSSETAVEVIGGCDKYIATCRRCFFTSSSPQNRSTANLLKPVQENVASKDTNSVYKRRLAETPDVDVLNKENTKMEMA
ncbi:thymidine kinase, cytosolic-like isoform X2 [Homarus americanus]|uniref:thymidine kinase, cytosolic-like isoform X2 n=1 Tax=Homarus americanus TaxID=6706 RepID=UPI001C48B1B0|nr:thymidine kinase, cytosolic-like isoform X2 [Homarus americanus]